MTRGQGIKNIRRKIKKEGTGKQGNEGTWDEELGTKEWNGELELGDRKAGIRE